MRVLRRHPHQQGDISPSADDALMRRGTHKLLHATCLALPDSVEIQPLLSRTSELVTCLAKDPAEVLVCGLILKAIP